MTATQMLEVREFWCPLFLVFKQQKAMVGEKHIGLEAEEEGTFDFPISTRLKLSEKYPSTNTIQSN